ncbi:VOC family protein [Sphingobacterium siyangense]|uniref:VOC family protein n=1 Tax=Sphingobacterium siyangense TaxID=459529 RepID=UPI003DA3FCDF
MASLIVHHLPNITVKAPVLRHSDQDGRIDITTAAADRSLNKGYTHQAISVGGKDAVDNLTEQLRSDGYIVESEPRTTGDGYYESVVLDPEGNPIEIVA